MVNACPEEPSAVGNVKVRLDAIVVPALKAIYWPPVESSNLNSFCVGKLICSKLDAAKLAFTSTILVPSAYKILIPLSVVAKVEPVPLAVLNWTVKAPTVPFQLYMFFQFHLELLQLGFL